MIRNCNHDIVVKKITVTLRKARADKYEIYQINDSSGLYCKKCLQDCNDVKQYISNDELYKLICSVG